MTFMIVKDWNLSLEEKQSWRTGRIVKGSAESVKREVRKPRLNESEMASPKRVDLERLVQSYHQNVRLKRDFDYIRARLSRTIQPAVSDCATSGSGGRLGVFCEPHKPK